MKNEITDFMELRDQFDVRLQGCFDDCKEYMRTTAAEVRKIEGMGVNCHDPSMDDINAGFEVAQILGITYCYVEVSGKKSYNW